MTRDELEALVFSRHVSEPTRLGILAAIAGGADERTVRAMLDEAEARGHALRQRFVSDRSRAIPSSPLVPPEEHKNDG